MIDPDSPLAPLLLGVVLVALFAVLIVRAIRKDRREYRRFKRFRDTRKRQRMYRRWLIDSVLTFGGSSVFVLLLSWKFVPLFLADINSYDWVRSLRAGFDSTGGLGIGIVVGLLAAIIGGGLLAIMAVRKTDTVAAIGDIQALLPRNRDELRYGAALSINAGIVEELLFRMAVPAVIFGITGSGVSAVIGSLLLFGLLHAYQGLGGVIGSTIIGALLMGVYLASGSILLTILVHALIDLRSLVLIPVLVFRVHKVHAEAI